MHRCPLCLLIALSLLATGCGARVKALRSRVPRATPASQAQAHVRDLVAGNTAFALDLYHKLPADGNLALSPYCVSLSLAMTYAGARGDTEREMGQVLHFAFPQSDLHAAFNALDRQLAEIPEGGPQLHLATSVWLQPGFSVRPEYLDRLAANYGAGVQTVDFQHDGPRALRAVNSWVEDRTAGRITDLIPPHDTSQTVLVLADALYLKAEWQEEFHAGSTQPRSFTPLAGAPFQVSMMARSGQPGYDANYAEGPGFQALELVYKGDRLSMVFLLPASGRFREVEHALSAAQLQTLWRDLATSVDRYIAVEIELPKFTFDSGASVKGALSALGLRRTFDPKEADFTGLSTPKPVWIQDVWQKGYVAVNEKGTEVAAAAAVGIAASAAPSGRGKARFIADRPFLFLLRDRQTNALLFLGRVLHPRA